MYDSYRQEANPHFLRQPESPPPGQPHQPPSAAAQVSPPPEPLPAQPPVRPPPRHAPHRAPTRHSPYPIHPRYQTGVPPPPSPPRPQPGPRRAKSRGRGTPVVGTPPPRPPPIAPISPPPHHDDQTQPLHTGPGLSPPPVQAPPPRPSPTVPVPRQSKTHFLTWSLAVFCLIFWVVVIVGGLIVLIVYLVFRPHLPKLDISSATLNAAYLDMGYLLNADMTLLTNFTNPNRKVRNDFSYVILDLYYGSSAIATQYIEPFSTSRLESRLADVHMISSQVRLPSKDSEKLRRQLEGNGLVMFEVRGLVRVRSRFGSFLRYSYWLYSHCSIALTGPPSGVLRASRCRTKR